LRRLDDLGDAALEAMPGLDVETRDWEIHAADAMFYELVSMIDLRTGDPEQANTEPADALLLYERRTAGGRVDIPADSRICIARRRRARCCATMGRSSRRLR
jgi:hypothetical protein